MIDYIHSDTLKKYYNDNNISLTPAMVAALIYNSAEDHDDIYASLKEFTESLDDNKLKNEIINELKSNLYKWKEFICNEDNTVFVLTNTYQYPNSDILEIDLGLFYNYNDAFAVLKNEVDHGHNINDYIIEKRNIYKHTSVITFENYYMTIGQVKFNNEFRRKSFWVHETRYNSILTKEDKNNFKMRFQLIPSPFYKGQPVRCISNNKLYITDDFSSAEEKIEKLKMWNGYEDFSDNVIFCWYLDKDGMWEHEHIMPTNLEFDFTDAGNNLYIKWKNEKMGQKC